MPVIEGCKHSLEITIPLEEIQAETEKALVEIQKQVRLPGFRPGKAPVSLIRTKFKEDIRQQVLEKLLPKAFLAKAEEEHLDVVGKPDVKDLHFHEGEPIRFTAEFEVAPEIELNTYRELPVPYEAPDVADAEIEERIAKIRDQKAEFVNEEPRPVADGDHAVVSIRSIAGVDGEPVESDEMVLHIGDSETMPEFSENLRGASPGEEREFDVTYPEDYGQDRLAGKTVRFNVTLKGIRRKELPELNDEFARDLGDFQTLEELREAVRKAVYSEKEFHNQQEAKSKLIDQLVDSHEFPVPEAYVDRQIEMNMEQRLQELASQGLDVKKLNLDWHKVKAAQKDRATRDVKASLLLGKIADKESIYATKEEVDGEIQRFAKRQREPVAAVRQRFEKDGTAGRIAGRIRTEKVLNFLFENARKTPKEPETATEPQD